MADDTALWHRLTMMGTRTPGGPKQPSWPIQLDVLQKSLGASDIEISTEDLAAKLASPPADFPWNVEMTGNDIRFNLKS